MLCYSGCFLPDLRSHGRSHDKQTEKEDGNETEILHRDIYIGKIPIIYTLHVPCKEITKPK